MKWYNFIASFFAGAFLINVIPHFVQGVSGNPFPTPFSNPPGIGLSSPVLNVIWGLINLVIGYFLFRGGKVATNKWSLLVFFVGGALMAIQLSLHFVNKMPQ